MAASNAKFQIPSEFQDQLVYRKPTDSRSDAEILESLTNYQPVTSEKNIWAFWHSGIKSMPGWCQRNVINWVKLQDSSWTVRVLDALPDSPNYMLNYVPASLLNTAMVNGKMDGPYFGPHSADLLRGACLITHGGVNMDVGCILIRDLDKVCWDKLADPKSPYQVAAPWMYGQVIANHFVAARKNDPFIKRWHELFVYLWKDRTNYEGLRESPLLAFVQEKGFEDSRQSDFHWDFKVDAATVFEYITQVVCWMRLSMLEDIGDGFSGVDYWQNNILIWDVLQENWAGEKTVGWDNPGQRMFDLLQVRLDSDPNSEKYKEAYRFVYRLLTDSTMQKITHGKGLTDSVHLGVLFDENEGSDCEPGTFGELLRYGTVHFEQTRKEIRYSEPPMPAGTMKKGLLEP